MCKLAAVAVRAAALVQPVPAHLRLHVCVCMQYVTSYGTNERQEHLSKGG